MGSDLVEVWFLQVQKRIAMDDHHPLTTISSFENVTQRRKRRKRKKKRTRTTRTTRRKRTRRKTPRV
jgi:hypothetical protein